MNKDPPAEQELYKIAEHVANHVIKFLQDENIIASEYMDTKQAAKFLSLSKQRLETWRSFGGGPKWAKISQAVRYRKSDLVEFMRSKTKLNTITKWRIAMHYYTEEDKEYLILKTINWAKSDKYTDLVSKNDLIKHLDVKPGAKHYIGQIIVNDVGDFRRQLAINGKRQYCFHFPSREFLIEALEKALPKYAVKTAQVEEVSFEGSPEKEHTGFLHEGSFKFIKKNRIVGKCPDCGTIIVKG